MQLYQLQIMTALLFPFLIIAVASFSRVMELARIPSASVNSGSGSGDPLPNLKQTRSHILSPGTTCAVGSLKTPV